MRKQTRGFCKYCGKEYTKTGMVKHLKTCKERNVIFEQATGQTAWYQLLLQSEYMNDYWLIIQIKEGASLKKLDQFIRDIWVECCGHLSCFEINGQLYESVPYMGKSMNSKLNNVFRSGMTIKYEYDYGSTTSLIIRVLDYYSAPAEKKDVVILSRNNPPEILCAECEKNKADWVNPYEYFDNGLICNECLKARVTAEIKEEDPDEEIDEDYISEITDQVCEDYLPVCNSPRMGVCGYDGSRYYPDQFVPDQEAE